MEEIIKTVPTPPKEGYVIDREKSTIDEIVWKPIRKNASYEDVCKDLFMRKDSYMTDNRGKIITDDHNYHSIEDLNLALTTIQLKKMLAYNKLMNIAVYLNDGWKPNWKLELKEDRFCIIKDCFSEKYVIDNEHTYSYGNVFFKTEELAEQAMVIMGQEDLDILFKD